jgi:hypothetical protein
MQPRGATEDIYGRYQALMTAEYRFPLLYVERGFSTWPFFLKNVSGALLVDIGAASDDFRSLSYADSRQCLGAEITSRWIFSYAAPFKITLGGYHLPDENESRMVLKLSSAPLW